LLTAAYKVFFIISCSLQSRAAYIFYFFTLSKGIIDAQSFLGCIFLNQTFFSQSMRFNITCTSVTGVIMMNRRQL